MKNQLIILFFMSFAFAQISMSQINEMADKELDKIRNELQAENLITKNQDFDNDINQNFQNVEILPPNQKLKEEQIESKFFGYDFFKKEINFFDNVPTPSNFKLGAGDEIIISLWGETNFRKSYTINKEGLIYFENIGFINVSNKSLSEAENILTNELASIYSTLKDVNKSTRLMIELGKLKSINVYFTGQVINPGISLIHPFSDVFSALVQVGGVDESGSLRQIKLIRNGEIIETIDFYSFFTSGMSKFQKIGIIDGDVIHVPPVKKRVEFLGEINNPKFYEALDSESLQHLIEYAGGLKSTSSNKALIENILPLNKRLSDDFARSGLLFDLSFSKNLSITDGLKVNFLPIANNEFSVQIYGRVASPGKYPAFTSIFSSSNQQVIKKASLKEVLDLAGGFNDPIFRKTINENIKVLRLDENSFYGKELNVTYSESENFTLEVNDKVFVYENPNYNRGLTFTITGEVAFPGTYPLKMGTSLSEAISIAGGLTELGSSSSISITKKFKKINEEGDETEETENVINADLNFKLADGNIINVLPLSNVFQVEGNVYNPGLIALNDDSRITIKKAIELAGGFKPHSLKKSTYVVRANGKIDKPNFYNFKKNRVYSGDLVFVPEETDKEKFNVTDFISNLSSTLANIAAILIVVQNNQ